MFLTGQWLRSGDQAVVMGSPDAHLCQQFCTVLLITVLMLQER